MNRLSPLFLSVTALVCALSLPARALDVPFLSGRVNDTAGMLSPQTVGELEALLKAHEDSTSNQVVVLTVPSLQGEGLEEYTMKVAETWKLGRADRDNGVILLIARDDRAVRIEVGSGLEGELPDITCGRIIRREIVPRFRDGDYDAGVQNGVRAILDAIRGAYVPSETSKTSGPNLPFFTVFLGVVGVFTFLTVVTPGRGGWFLYLFLIPFWLSFPTVSLGVVAGGVLFALYLLGVPVAKIWFARTEKGRRMLRKLQASRTGHRDGGWWVSSGSSDWTSSGGGGSFSGGGGSFSGGGASGRW